MTTNWEHKVITLQREGNFRMSNTPQDDEIAAVLNREGAQGWELVNAVIPAYAQPVTLFLKRPR